MRPALLGCILFICDYFFQKSLFHKKMQRKYFANLKKKSNFAG